MNAIGYNQIIKKIIVGFGSIFDNMTVLRFNTDGSENQRFVVPIIFAPKEKYVARLLAGDERKVQTVLPRMSYDLLGIKYDSSRKQITMNKTSYPSSNPNTLYSVLNPVPYDFSFSLYIYVRNIEDGTQLVESILPYFTPDYTIKLNLNTDLNIIKEIPITLNSVSYDVEFEGESDSETRVVIWTLSFTAKGFIYGPTTEAKVIKQVFTNMYNNPGFGVPSIQFNMSSTSSFGTYQIGETVFQGYSMGTATAIGTVSAFDTKNYKLTVSNITGNFTTNTIVHGFNTNAAYILNSLVANQGVMVIANTTVSPSTANSTSNYSYVTKITEY
jgi:hypothetical protein